MNKKLLGLLFFGVLMGAMDIALLAPAINAIQKSFHVSSREIIWVINAYVFSNLISTPMLAGLSDRYGRKIIYILSIMIFGLGSLVVIFSGSFNLLIAGRGIQGFGSGGFFPVATAVIGDSFPKEKQGSALGILGAVYGLAFILGPVIGGLFLLISWHWVFVINLPMSIVLIIASLKLFPAKTAGKNVSFDWKGMFLLISCLGLFAYSVSHINTKDFISSLLSVRVVPYLIISLLILLFLIYYQKKSENPFINTQLFKSKQLILAYLLAFGAGLGETAMMFLPGYIKEMFDISYSNASFALIPMLAALLIGAPLAGRFIDAAGVKYVLLFGTAILTAGLVSIWKAHESITSFYIAEAVLGLGFSFLTGAPLRYIVNNETSEDTRASGQGVIVIFTSVGLIVSSSLAGALIASMGGGTAGYKGAFLSLSLVSALMIFAPIGLKPKDTNQGN